MEMSSKRRCLYLAIVLATMLLIGLVYNRLSGSRRNDSFTRKVMDQHSYIRHSETSTQLHYDHRHSSSSRTKILYAATDLWQGQLWQDVLDSSDCPFTCRVVNSTDFHGVEEADVVIFALDYIHDRYPSMNQQARQQQYWFVMSYESSAYSFNHFPANMDGKFNGVMAYRRRSAVYYPWGKTIPLQHHATLGAEINFAENKTKGAFAYISNCDSMDYNRMDVVKKLSKYIDIDIFGKCGNKNPPCENLKKGGNPECEAQMHKPYRFFIAFENSLCKDYITEKFWDRLQSKSLFIPVAMGGLTLEDYTAVAPLDSFLHLYNFTSVDALGIYLNKLVHDNSKYNGYHRWRNHYEIDTKRNMGACDLCKIANRKPKIAVRTDLTTWWNSDSNCRNYP